MSFTLITGQSITDPMNQPATAAECLPYQCGDDPTNTAAIQWCSFWGQSGNITCGNPAQIVQPEPSAPPIIQPSLPVLTPANVTQPLPDITAAVAPNPIVPDESLWCAINSAIAENPLLAVLALAAAAVLLWPKGAR
jgi:hypothetical protein